MRYNNPTIREHLASAYALGALHGRARARFEHLLEDDAELRRLTVEYQETLTPLALQGPEVTPPPQVRERLAKLIAPPQATSDKPRWWQRFNFWPQLAAANGVLALALVAFIGAGLLRTDELTPPSELVYVGVLSDAQQKPGVAVLAYNKPFRVDIEAKTPLSVEPGSELKLWLRDRETDQAVYVATIPAGQKSFPLDDAGWKLLRSAKALLISRENLGSSNDAPGDDILYQGVCVNLKKWSETKPQP